MGVSVDADAAINEICTVEGDDALHDYGGSHGVKGHDFARFWLIKELMSLSQRADSDYLFVLEYVQDIAKFDSAASPTAVTFYQLKKKEGAPWDMNGLAGLSQRAVTMKVDSPLAKLMKAVLTFKCIDSSAEFVSNNRFKVALSAGGTAVSMDYVTIADTERREVIKQSAAEFHGVEVEDVPLDKVGLRYAPIEVNDMRIHVVGIAHEFLSKLSTEHAAQAHSFVDALYAKLGTASRNTSKCATWQELIAKRGYSREDFLGALDALKLLPDQHVRRMSTLQRLERSLGWHPRESMRIEVALTSLAAQKLVGGTLSEFSEQWSDLLKISKEAEVANRQEVEEFNEMFEFLSLAMPDSPTARLRAAAIYAMVEAWTNQTYD